MFFNYIAGIQEIDKEKVKINHRDAVRAVIVRGNDILMVHNNKGDYKFPGGGANNGESHNQTLKREVREETGYIVIDVKDKIGVFTERKLDDKDENSIFEMTSYYYECEVSKDETIQQLDDYEEQLDFKPVWISLDEAIRLNEEVLKNKADINSWVYREASALIAIREYHCKVTMLRRIKKVL